MLHDIKNHVVRWLQAEREIRRLRRLDDHLLADLGIERDHISSLVRGRCAP